MERDRALAPGAVAVLFRFALLLAIKGASRVFFRFTVEWVGEKPARPFAEARTGLLLNHTSLFEPIFFGAQPWIWLWKMASRGLMPGADSTLDRPFVGRLLKWLVPTAMSVTRNRDRTWSEFVARVDEESVVVMAPEGRMKRANGLDKHGRPMTVRGGIVDILERQSEGTMVLLYSGGLHHVHTPGDAFPRLFQTVRVRFEEIPIARYKREMGHGTAAFRDNVIADLERRRDQHCRW